MAVESCYFEYCCYDDTFNQRALRLERPRTVFLKFFCLIIPFLLSTHCYWPPNLMQQAQGSIFNYFYLKKLIHIMIATLVRLTAFTKLRNIGRHFSEVQS